MKRGKKKKINYTTVAKQQHFFPSLLYNCFHVEINLLNYRIKRQHFISIRKLTVRGWGDPNPLLFSQLLQKYTSAWSPLHLQETYIVVYVIPSLSCYFQYVIFSSSYSWNADHFWDNYSLGHILVTSYARLSPPFDDASKKIAIALPHSIRGNAPQDRYLTKKGK